MTPPQSRLEGKCTFRIQADTKAIRRLKLSQKDMECLYQCSGHNVYCTDYTGLIAKERIVTYSQR